jgi:hypothetical protein
MEDRQVSAEYRRGVERDAACGCLPGQLARTARSTRARILASVSATLPDPSTTR